MEKQNPFINTFFGIREREDNPWLASATYEEKDECRFKGRKEDTDRIVTMLQQNDSVVCYAASGDGKSSLINAGICPAIRRIGFFPIKITFSTDEFKGIGLPSKTNSGNLLDFDMFIFDKILQSIEEHRKTFKKEHGINEDYVVSFEKIAKYENIVIDNSLWWKLRTETIQLPYGEFDYVPVLIFDQFEEVFRATWKADFFKWLESLMRDVCPKDIVDVFGGNIKDLPNKKLFKTIFSMRYEYIGELDYWCSQQYFIPQMIKSRYYLRALNMKQAKQVVCEQTIGEERALQIIKEKANEILSKLTDKDISFSAVEKKEISAILLSIMCFTYYNQLVENSVNEELPSARDLVAKYYESTTNWINPEELLLIEKELVSFDGTRKRIRKKDANGLFYIVFQDQDKTITIGDILLSVHVLRQYIINNEEYVELAHDKIAEVVKEKIDRANDIDLQRKNREKNREKRLIRENVLTIFGRELFENEILDFGPDGDDTRTSLVSEIIRSNFSPDNAINRAGITSLSQIIKDSDSDDNSLCISFVSENGQKISMTKDGIYNLLVKIDDKQRVTKVLFYDIDKEHLILTRNGFCGIELEYDEKTGNEIKRTYLGKDEKPTITLLCYSIVRREYDSCNRPIKTTYFDVDGETPCKHFNGNCGFNSEYDDNGNEILRTFFDKEGSLRKIQKGIFGQKAKYNGNNQLEYVINIDENQEPCQSFWGVTALHIEYDNQTQRVFKETFCDSNLSPILCREGYSTAIFKYNEQNLVVENSFLDEQGSKVLRREGYHKWRIKYDKRGFPEYVFFLGMNDESVFTNEGNAILKRVFNDVGQEIELQLLGPDLFPSYSIYNFNIQKTSFNDYLPIAVEFNDHHNNRILCLNRLNRIETIWDTQGRHKVKTVEHSQSYGKISSEVIEMEWLDDNTYIATNIATNGAVEKTKCHTDLAGRDIYQEMLHLNDDFHHKTIEYDSNNHPYIELYYKKNGDYYFDDINDCGTEYLYDGEIIVGIASLGPNGRHRNNQGYCVRMVFQNEIGERKYCFYDIDGITPVNNIAYGAHCIDYDGCYYDEKMKLCNNKEGYAYIERTDDSYAYFDKEGLPVGLRNVHKCNTTHVGNTEEEKYVDVDGNLVLNDAGYAIKTTIRKGNAIIESYFDANRQLVNNNEGYAIKKTIIYNEFQRLFLKTTHAIRYYGSNKKKIDGPHPIDESNEAVRGCYFRIIHENEQNSVCFAKKASGKKIEGSRNKDILQTLFVVSLFVPALIYALFSSLVERLKKKKDVNIAKSTTPVVLIKEVFPEVADPTNLIGDNNRVTSLAVIAGIQENDIILQYGNWDYTNYTNPYDSIDNFEKEFNTKKNEIKRITIARMTNDNNRIPIIDSFWVPKISIGLRIVDGTFPGTNEELALIINEYKKHNSSNEANSNMVV